MKRARSLARWLGACALLVARPSFAHDRELGVGVTSGVTALPAIIDGSRSHAESAALRFGAAIEYSVIDDVTVEASASYAYALSSVSAGAREIQDHAGVYIFTQDALLLLTGIKLESRTWLYPLTASIAVDAGAYVLEQSQRTLSNGANLSYGLTLPPQTTGCAVVSATVALSMRLRDQIRVALQPNLQILFEGSGPTIGVGIDLAMSFLRFL